MQNKSRVSIFRENWFQGIFAFCFVQVVFILMELTGWIPNVKDFDGKLFSNIINLFNMNQ
ncbi:YfzA family protein [Solibacillus cecembensis]|uniref:YfzA family protein n=1 Tax=Solibacillus cecembensis TaxID=459347 RepID=UPI003CFC50D5